VDADGRALGTVGLVPAGMPNGRHRAEITKLAVRREARRQGLARRLLATAEHAATADGVTLLVLDTETGSAAERLYAAAGWQRLAEIPEYATDPAGVPRGTTLYTKRPLPDPGAGAAVTVTEAPVPGLAGLLGAYHLATEAEKGVPVAGAGLLPARYRAEVTDPRAAFGTATVLTALDATGTALGCVVLTRDGEVKRLWTDPAARGRGTGAALLDAAVGRARSRGADVVRLTVWRWRAPALALYAAYGFRPAARAWDDLEGLVCLELPL
jgi:putative acetyltransferase